MFLVSLHPAIDVDRPQRHSSTFLFHAVQLDLAMANPSQEEEEAESSATSSQKLSFDEQLTLIEQLALSKQDGVLWDQGFWLVKTLDELEVNRRYHVRLAQELLQHLEREPLLVQLKEARTKGKARADSPVPPAHIECRLNRASWVQVKAVLDSDENEGRRYWSMLTVSLSLSSRAGLFTICSGAVRPSRAANSTATARLLREFAVLHSLLKLVDNPQEHAATFAADLLHSFYDHPPPGPFGDGRPDYVQTATETDHQRVRMLVDYALQQAKKRRTVAAAATTGSPSRKSKQLNKPWQQLKSRIDKRRSSTSDSDIRKLVKDYKTNLQRHGRHVIGVAEAVKEWESWLNELDESEDERTEPKGAATELEDAASGGVESAGPAVQGLQPPTSSAQASAPHSQTQSQSTSEKTNSTLAYTNPSPPASPAHSPPPQPSAGSKPSQTDSHVTETPPEGGQQQQGEAVVLQENTEKARASPASSSRVEASSKHTGAISPPARPTSRLLHRPSVAAPSPVRSTLHVRPNKTLPPSPPQPPPTSQENVTTTTHTTTTTTTGSSQTEYKNSSQSSPKQSKKRRHTQVLEDSLEGDGHGEPQAKVPEARKKRRIESSSQSTPASGSKAPHSEPLLRAASAPAAPPVPPLERPTKKAISPVDLKVDGHSHEHDGQSRWPTSPALPAIACDLLPDPSAPRRAFASWAPTDMDGLAHPLQALIDAQKALEERFFFPSPPTPPELDSAPSSKGHVQPNSTVPLPGPSGLVTQVKSLAAQSEKPVFDSQGTLPSSSPSEASSSSEAPAKEVAQAAADRPQSTSSSSYHTDKRTAPSRQNTPATTTTASTSSPKKAARTSGPSAARNLRSAGAQQRRRTQQEQEQKQSRTLRVRSLGKDHGKCANLNSLSLEPDHETRADTSFYVQTLRQLLCKQGNQRDPARPEQERPSVMRADNDRSSEESDRLL